MRFRTPFWPQWLAAFEVSLLALVITMSFTWSPSLSDLLSTRYELQILVQLLKISSKVFGIILGTIATSLVGASITVYTCGFVCLANSIFSVFIIVGLDKLVYAYLVCTEIVLGAFICASPIYVSEMSNPKIRGKLISLVIQGAVTGNSLGNLVYMYLGPSYPSIIMLGSSILFVALFHHSPPTSYFLMSRGRTLAAQKSVKWYNCKTDGCHEIESLSAFFEANPPKPLFKTIPEICTPINRSALLCFTVIFAVQNLSGLFAILFQMDSLFNNAPITIFNLHEMVITIGIITTISSWMFFFLSDTFERDDTLLAGFIALSVAIFSWGGGYHLIELGYSEQRAQWLIFISAIVYQITMNISYLPITYMIMSEIFSFDVKPIAVCLCNIVISVSLFISNNYFDLVANILSHKLLFYVSAVVTIMTGVYYTTVIPKTRKKSLLEIQAMFKDDQGSLESIQSEFGDLIELHDN